MQVRANGIGIEVESHGADGAPAFLLIRGLGTQLIHWPAVLLEALVGEGFRVVVFDNRDVGLSEKLDGPGASYSVADMAADTEGVLDALAIDRAHVAGISMGGMIAQWLAAERPERCRSLASIMSSSGARGLPGPTPEALDALVSVPEDPSDRDCVIAHNMRTQRVFESPAFAPTEAELRSLFSAAYDRCNCPEGVTRQMRAVAASGDRSGRLAGMRVPTLVVHGTDDPLIPPAAGRDTAARIPGARLELVEGMGHDVTPANAPILARLLVDHARAADARG
ncbi:MAG: alpha/beta fold hydrolase [Myxococcota bacterium]